MANNPYVNKVEYAGQTLVDLTNDTATPSDVLNGVTFHDRSGAVQTGSLIIHNVYDGLDSTSTDDALSANQGKELNSKIQKLDSTQFLTSNDDLNTVGNGRFNITAGNVPSNCPVSSNALVETIGQGQKYQILYYSSSGIPYIYVRRYYNSWGNWYKFSGTAV